MKTINFLLQIGTSLSQVQSEVSIYGITESGQQMLANFSMDESSAEVSFEQGEFNYYMAVALIEGFTSGGKTYAIPNEHTVELFAVFQSSDSFVALNEAITVANAFCFTQSLTVTNSGEIQLKATDRVLGLSMGMRNNFISTNGILSDVITSSPNAFETNSYALWISLANLFYNAMTISSVYSDFLHYASRDSNSLTTLFGAFQAIIRNPFTSVPEIYGLIENHPIVFHPSLTELSLPHGVSPQPDQWTLAIKVHNSGADNYLFAGVAYIAFDKNDRGWVANNVVQGTPNSASCCMVLEPNGKPAEFSPVFGGGIVGVGFGVTVDNAGENIYFGSFGWGPTQCNPFEGAVAQFATDGTTLSPTNGWTKGLSRVQGLNFDQEGNLWVTSWGSQEPLAPAPTIYPFENKESAIVVFPKKEDGLPDFDHPISYPLGNPFRATFDVACNPVNGAMYVACAGTENKNNPAKNGFSGVYRFTLKNGEIQQEAAWDKETSKDAPMFEGFRQVNFDRAGNVYVGAIKKGYEPISDTEIVSGILKFDEDLNFIEKITDKIDRPWSVTIDKNDTIFAGNFGPELVEYPLGFDLPLGSTGVTVVKQESTDDNEWHYVSRLMTLPTGGSEVKLANGFPLYGVLKDIEIDENGHEIEVPVYRPCYSPLMRITSSSVDGAGNLWVNNNWKPSGAVDLLENPGGDGLVIFVGVAAPEPYRF